MSEKVYVVGVGMTNFVKPNNNIDYPEIGKKAVDQALNDCGVSYDRVQQAVCGYIYGDSACGQRVLYQVGMTGIPIINVNNHGATGGTALYLAHQIIQGGLADVVLALGFEKMAPGQLPASAFPDRTYPMDKHSEKVLELIDVQNAPLTAQCFGSAAVEHMKKYGSNNAVQFAKIAVKNHNNSAKNPKAISRHPYTLDDVLNSKHIYGPLTKLQCCSNSDGAAAAVLMSGKAIATYGLHHKAVEIIGMSMATDTEEVFTGKSMMKVAGYDMTVLAARKVYEKTGISPSQIDLVELHDCFSCNELLTYEGLQLCGEGKGAEFVDVGDNTYGGKVVVNPSGGLLGKGNPIAATGLAQCAEIVWQLRGEAEDRQVPNARIGLQHNLGLGGAVVVAIYSKPIFRIPDRKSAAAPEIFRVHKHLKCLENWMKNNGNGVQIKGIFGLKLLNAKTGGSWTINVNDRKITYMGDEKPNVTFSGTDEDLEEVITGKVDPISAYYHGKLKVQGDVNLAVELQKFVAGQVRAKI